MSGDRHERLIQRLMAGEDPAQLAREAGDERAVAEATRALEWISLATTPIRPVRDLRASVLDATDPRSALAGFAQRTAGFFRIADTEARSLLESVEHVDQEPWFDDQVAGVRMRPVDAPELAEATCLLVHLEPGVAYPTHRHLGDEWCLFLQGHAREAEREWSPGDLVLNPGGSEHPVLEAIGDEPFVFALVLHEGVEFTDRP